MGWLGGEIISLNCCKCLQIKSTFFQAITARLRSETTLPLKWIVARVQFEYSYYGMYSRQLRGELDSLIADNLLVEKEGMNAYGGPSFTFEVQPKLEGFLDELGVEQEPAWTAAAKKLDNYSAQTLEGISTILFLKRRGLQGEQLKQRLLSLKPHLAAQYDACDRETSTLLQDFTSPRTKTLVA